MKIGPHIGRRVRELRKARDMTQQDLARLSGLLQGNISRLERGDVEDVLVSTLTSLARALGVTREELLADAPEGDPAVKVGG
jgi:transcriptional regulator with XRE-family HTH domain